MNDDTVKLVRIPADTWRAVVEALEWYAKQAQDCRKVHAEGDIARNLLSRDGGDCARAALELARKVSAE